MEKITKFLFWLFTFSSPVNGIMITMVFLIVVDFITGSYASIKQQQPIKSARITHTISKFFIYNLVILSAYFLEKHIIEEVPFLKIIAGFIAITEIKSILENFNTIYGVNPFKALIKLIKLTSFKEAIKIITEDKAKAKDGAA